MDTHHKVQYGLISALAMSAAGFITMSPAAKPSWPVLTVEQAVHIVKDASAVIGDKPLNIYCIDTECSKIERALVSAAKSAKVKYHTERPLFIPDGMSVGALSQADADKLAKAVVDATGGVLKPDAVPGQQTYYVGFGRLVED